MELLDYALSYLYGHDENTPSDDAQLPVLHRPLPAYGAVSPPSPPSLCVLHRLAHPLDTPHALHLLYGDVLPSHIADTCDCRNSVPIEVSSLTVGALRRAARGLLDRRGEGLETSLEGDRPFIRSLLAVNGGGGDREVPLFFFPHGEPKVFLEGTIVALEHYMSVAALPSGRYALSVQALLHITEGCNVKSEVCKGFYDDDDLGDPKGGPNLFKMLAVVTLREVEERFVFVV